MALNTVKVLFENPSYNYSTNISEDSTLESATKYFVGKTFDLGTYPVELMATCIAIEFINNNKVTRTKGQWLTANHSPKKDDEELKVNIVQYGQCDKRNGSATLIIASLKASQVFNYSNEEVEANAAFICKAVNNYDMLLSALKEVVARFPVGQYNVKKDFEKLVALAAASKAIHTAEEEK